MPVVVITVIYGPGFFLPVASKETKEDKGSEVRRGEKEGEIKSKIQIPGQRIYNIIKKIKEIFIKAPVQWETVWVCYGLPLLWTEFERK